MGCQNQGCTRVGSTRGSVELGRVGSGHDVQILVGSGPIRLSTKKITFSALSVTSRSTLYRVSACVCDDVMLTTLSSVSGLIA